MGTMIFCPRPRTRPLAPLGSADLSCLACPAAWSQHRVDHRWASKFCIFQLKCSSFSKCSVILCLSFSAKEKKIAMFGRFILVWTRLRILGRSTSFLLDLQHLAGCKYAHCPLLRILSGQCFQSAFSNFRNHDSIKSCWKPCFRARIWESTCRQPE